MGVTLTRAAVAAAIVLTVAWFGFLRPAGHAGACGPAGPYDFDTYEPEQYQAAYGRAIELAVAGKAVTSTYTVGPGEIVDVRYQGLLKGPRTQRTTNPDLNARIPPTIFKSIAWIESNWATGANAVPYGGVGPALRSFDCGYGLSQVTTGMGNNTGSVSARQALIGTHYLFNIAEGVRILADKWNGAPRFRPIAGNGDPAAIEDWYFAVWGYNGFAFSNHPLNPARNPLRGDVFHCDDHAAPNWSGFLYGDYTYPERVYGCMRYPPIRDGQRLWTAQTFDMPHLELEVVANAFKPSGYDACDESNWSGGCPAMDFPTTIRANPLTAAPSPTPTPGSGSLVPTATPPRTTATAVATGTGTATGTATATATGTVTSTATSSATATQPATPGSLPPRDIVTHVDTTPLPNPVDAAAFFGDPKLVVTGPKTATLTAYPDGSATSVSLVVENAGRGIGPFRIRASAPWIVARHPDDPAARTLDAGVVVGKDTEVVLVAPNATRKRVAQSGYRSSLTVTLDSAKMPPGESSGKLWVEPLLGGGGAFEIQVTGSKAGNTLRFRAIMPQLAGD